MMKRFKQYLCKQKESIGYRLMSEDLLKVKIQREGHRLDKACYNDDQFRSNKRYLDIVARLSKMIKIWHSKNYPKDDPVIVWAEEILKNFNEEVNKDVEVETINSNMMKKTTTLDFLGLINERRSVRSWTEEKISNEVIKSLIDAARWAPSSSNRQPCAYLVVQNERGKQILSELREPFCSKASVLFLVVVDMRGYDDVEKDCVPYLDASVAIENLLLAAHCLGLGACYMKLCPGDLAQFSKEKIEEFKSFFRIPPYFLPTGVIALGYPKIIPKAPARKRISDILFFEAFEG